MHVAGHPYDLMSSDDLRLIHQSALRILDEIGMEVQDRRLLEVLAAHGGSVDFGRERVTYAPSTVEDYIASVERVEWDSVTPEASGSAGVYDGLYHDPFSGELAPWTEESLASYFALAASLDHLHGATLLGSRIPVPGPLEPLYERYYAWKYSAREHGSIHLDELCPYILDLYEAVADDGGQSIQDVFRGTVYLMPPLKLGRHEAYQVSYFHERGLRVHVGDMLAMGASAPVTLAGAVTLNLAEQLALGMFNRALFGDRHLHLHASVSVMDMRTAIYPYGRPEMAITNLMTAQLARHYGVGFSGHAGLTDAKLPSVEAGAQKALTAIPTMLAGGQIWIDAGLLCIDQVFSPIQMVLDNEFLSALQHFTHEFDISEESIGLQAIIDAGPGGHFLDKEHTVRHMRGETWQPRLWSSLMLGPWLESGRRLDVDYARDIACSVDRAAARTGRLSEWLEQDVMGIIQKARERLVR
ncbi:MAG: hypothetical protein GX620_10580 [Chloroflexi bacterium]|nr:hypothetical protein [Chloroflexota bacterium]